MFQEPIVAREINDEPIAAPDAEDCEPPDLVKAEVVSGVRRCVHLNLRSGVCVGAAIFWRDALLLLRRIPSYRGRRELPGGSVEEGETLEEAVRREVSEETGLSVTVGAPFHASMFRAEGPAGAHVTVVAIEFVCATRRHGPIRLSPSEHDEYAWVPRKRLRRYPLVPAFTTVVAEAYRTRRNENARRRGLRRSSPGVLATRNPKQVHDRA